MANTRSALKRVRQNERRRLKNASGRSKMRNSLRVVREAISAKNMETVEENFRQATSELHRNARRGIIHKNTAARTISRLAAKIKALL